MLAHVDAGKTTLSEALLHASGTIDKLGRVDKKNSFLDTFSLERERGITIFSKQAILSFGDTEITLVDTPGHIDFSCEAERALSVQDYAILLISAPDGVTAHTRTLWQLLSARKIPTFIFVNKTDISERTRADIISEIKSTLTKSAVDYTSRSTRVEDSAGTDARLMEEYFDTGELKDESVCEAIAERRLFPCFFGSALKLLGISEFLADLARFTEPPSYNERIFAAKVYKIARDPQGRRLSYVKVTGGTLAAKDTLTVRDGDDTHFEKVEEIRIYSADKYKSVREAPAGVLCTLLGPTHTKAGMGLGAERSHETTITPVLDYRMNLPAGTSVYEAYLKLAALAEEDPTLSLSYNERAKEIRVRLMGEIQTEVLTRLIRDRFDLAVTFDEGSILYKETVAETVIGAGHFEPLRHYAEVHLRIEPLPSGSGIVAATETSTDLLALNWQRLVLTHIEEKAHRGVLTGSPLTDVKITLLAGKAHIKHTEGGDFRQATYRAIRQGLMKADSVLLEPTFNFRIEVPEGSLGRAMTDISAMCGTVSPPEFEGGRAILTGTAPVYTMRSYPATLRAYTAGEGKIDLAVGDYLPCHNSDEVIERIAYSPELDERNTPNSVFCKAGSGYVVPWNEADALMHVGTEDGDEDKILEERAVRSYATKYEGTAKEDKELMRIFESTYGKIKDRRLPERIENSAENETVQKKPKKQKPRGDDHIIIDGYNFIFASDSWRATAEKDISLARDSLVRIMCDYSAFKRCKVIIVFDAYKRKGGGGSVERLGDVSVVYTKEAETADRYIEKTTHDIAGDHRVRVVTSDYQEQLVVLGSGGLRVSAKEFMAELALTEKEIKEAIDSFK